MFLYAILAAITLLAVVFTGIYLLACAVDWHANAAVLPADHQPTFWQHVATDLAARRYDFARRWANRITTWGRTWWWLVAVSAGAVGCARFIGGTDYLLSWGGTAFRAASGAVLGYLVARFLLRINVSDVAAKYSPGSPAQADAAGKALIGSCIVVAAAILAVATGT